LVAARDLALSEAQKAKTAEIERQLRGEESAPRGEFQQYQSTLIAGVKDGKVDLAKLAEIKASMLKVVQERKDKEGEALDALYATLEPAQRKTLANTVRARQAERDARQPPRPPHEAHNGEDADAIKRRLDSLTKDLSLDDAQRKSTEALLAKDARPVGDDLEAAKEEMTRRMNATLVAFEGEGFSAKKLDLTSGSPGKMLDAMEQHAKFVSLLLPILKPDQRAKLAANMEKPFGPRVGPR
jgi:Spy/CpxP family protein refolding chaperone